MCRVKEEELRMTQPLTQPKNFCTTRLLFQNRSFVDFTEKSEHLDVRWGRSSWKWPFSLSKTRCALTVFIYTKNSAWRRHDFIYTKNFLRETGFYLHKEFRVAETWFYLHKEFLKRNRDKSMICLKNFPRCARQFARYYVRNSMKT